MGSAPCRSRAEQYQSKNVPYPTRAAPEPGTTHQIDMIGPRHLFGAAKFHTMNLIDVSSHRVSNHIVTETRPAVLVQPLCGIWGRVGIPSVAQFDNHANFRGRIPPAWQYFSPIVAACLDLDVTARFIPAREPWRNGVIKHFNDVWDKSFFRTEVFTGIDHLRHENTAFVEFHNTHHRYSPHAGATPNQLWHDRLCPPLPDDYQPPSRLPPKDTSKSSATSDRTASSASSANASPSARTTPTSTSQRIIKVRPRKLVVVDTNGEIIHHTDFDLSRELP